MAKIKDKQFSEMTKKELKTLYAEYYDLIYGQMPCYGTSDLRMLDSISRELDKRGVQINLTPNFS